MTWDFYDDGREIKLEKAKKSETILNSLNPKQRKALKKTLQAAEPTEFFGQDFTKLGELLNMIEGLEFTKSWMSATLILSLLLPNFVRSMNCSIAKLGI